MSTPLEGEQLLVPVLAALLVLMLALLGCLSHLSRASKCAREAEESAKMLLRELLSAGEQRQLARFGYLVVRSSSMANRAYRIPAHGGFVHGYESGEAVMTICLHPVGRLPAADVVLMHKLMIEGNEQEYLRQANLQWLRAMPASSHSAADSTAEPRADGEESL